MGNRCVLRFSVLVLLLSTVAACPAARTASHPGGENRAERAAQPPPILALLGQRDRLSLTSDQVVALDSIHQQWAAEDNRLMRRGTVVSAGFGGTSATSSRTAASTPEARANHRWAAQAVQHLLDREQQLAVCAFYQNPRSAVSHLWPWCDQ
jgi:hypothetical protein